MLKIRQLLVNQSYSPQYRAMLLLMIELVNNKYEIKNIQLREFYLSKIKPFSFEFPQKELKIVAEAKTENGNGTLLNVKLMFFLTLLNVKRNECK